MHRLLPLLLLASCVQKQTDRTSRQGAAEADGGGDSAPSAADGDTDAGGQDSGGVDPIEPGTEELRGIWITRWSWSSPAEIEAMMADVAASGFNTVFFQVRGTFDAYYDSGVEPWAARLTGTLGQDPGWDPLAVAVEAGHTQGLAVHAYLNTFPLWRGTEPPGESTPPHALAAHPQWLIADGTGEPQALNSSYVFASPGNPSVQAHIRSVATDIVRNYAVDGVHLDYIRYPGAGYSHDATSEARWAAEGGDWGDWQRAQVVATAAGVYDAVDVPVTAAVWGVHTNVFGWSGVSQGAVDYYQDSFAFLEAGALDANIPMIYWPVAEVEGSRLDFRVLVRDHVSHAAGRHVYAGMGGESVDFEQLVACIEVAREEGADGVVVFDYSLFASDLIRLREGVFAEDAVPPPMPWR
jgi:uncharacterized lipoprotein YddW (UPF0748 family)